MRIKKVPSHLKLLLLFTLSLFNYELSFSQMGGMDMTTTSRAKLPVTAESNESNAKQLASARSEGDSVEKIMSWVLSKDKISAGTIRAGEYRIVYALSAPEGWYEYSNNSVTWKEASNSNAHLWLFVLDGADGRVVPPLDINVTVRDADGNQVSKNKISYALMPLTNGYGENINFPGTGSYKLYVEILPPRYRRHDPYNGDRFTEVTSAVIPIAVKDFSGLTLLSEQMQQHQALAIGAGKGYKNTMDIMFRQANDGRDTTSGDYSVAYALEYSEGYWYSRNSKLVYKMDNEQSSVNNAHVEIAPRDKLTGRFLHDLTVTATLYKMNGDKIGTKNEMFMWHPWLYHYGENWRVPKAGPYQLHVHIDAPPYRRYGKSFGKQFIQPIDLDFNDIIIKTGQK